MYSSLGRNDRDFQNCPLYGGCPPLRFGVSVQGFTMVRHTAQSTIQREMGL